MQECFEKIGLTLLDWNHCQRGQRILQRRGVEEEAPARAKYRVSVTSTFSFEQNRTAEA